MANGWLRVLRVGFIILLPALLVSACAGLKPEDSDAWKDAQRPVLKARAEARWKALMQDDVKAAYQFLSPARRAVVSLQQFRGSIGQAVEWRVARATDIQYDGPTVASISMEVTYRFVMPRSGGKEIESKRVLIEKWLYSDGEWWYTSG